MDTRFGAVGVVRGGRFDGRILGTCGSVVAPTLSIFVRCDFVE